VPAPKEIIEYASTWSAQFSRVLAKGPIIRHDAEIAHWATAWRASRILFQSDEPAMVELARTLVGLSGFDNFLRSDIPSESALQFAQLSLSVHRMDELQRATTEHYWLVLRNRVTGLELDGVVFYQLAQLARGFGIPLSLEFNCQAVLSSEASEAGWNLLPIAA
jgi:hypothetical protein